MSEAAALRAMAAVQMGAQMLLWITFFAYDRTMQAVWQAALLLIVPLSALLWVWKGSALKTREGQWIALALLPCLLLDAIFVLFALSGAIGQIMPQYPGWVSVMAPCAFAFLTALCARVRGVSYGAYLLKWALILLFVFGTVFLRASTRGDRLWPLLGQGVSTTLLTALAGAGSLWGAALVVALPRSDEPKGRAVLWAVIPWALGCLWALWCGFIRPWARGDVLAVAEKLMGLARHAHSVTLYEMAGLLWLVLLPLSLTCCLSSAERLTLAAFPRCPRWVPLAGLILPAALCLLAWPGQVIGALEMLLPYRAAVSLLAGLGMMAVARREAKR